MIYFEKNNCLSAQTRAFLILPTIVCYFRNKIAAAELELRSFLILQCYFISKKSSYIYFIFKNWQSAPSNSLSFPGQYFILQNCLSAMGRFLSYLNQWFIFNILYYYALTNPSRNIENCVQFLTFCTRQGSYKATWKRSLYAFCQICLFNFSMPMMRQRNSVKYRTSLNYLKFFWKLGPIHIISNSQCNEGRTICSFFSFVMNDSFDKLGSRMFSDCEMVKEICLQKYKSLSFGSENRPAVPSNTSH